MVRKKVRRNILIGIVIGVILIASIVAIVSFNIPQQITGQGNYIERPVFKYLKCEPISSYKKSADYTIRENGNWLNRPRFTNKYDVIVDIESLPFAFGGHRFEYYVCNTRVFSETNCDPYSKIIPIMSVGDSKVTIPNVQPNQYVWAQFQKNPTGFKWVGSTGAVYKLGFVPYGLREYDILSGSANPVNANSCYVSNYPSKDDYLISEDLQQLNSKPPESNENTFTPEEVRWYVSGYLTSAEPSFALNYNGQDAWCRSTGETAEIYKINEVRLGSGTYKIASPDWSDLLGSKTCCPKATRGDEVCNNNFRWEKIKGSECGAFKSCGSPDWVSYDTKKIIKYSCVNGFCEQEIQNVQCSSDLDCINENQICDKNTWTCVNADVNLKGQTLTSLDEDLGEFQCSWFETYYEKETCGGNPLCWVGLEGKQLEKGCRIATWVIIVGIVGVLIILISIWVGINRLIRGR